MEPKFEQPKQHTPEEIAKLEKSRIFHDADLLEGGADYIADSSGSVRLEITPKQYTEKHNEAKASIREAIALEQWRKEEPERRERDRLAKIREAEEEKLDNLRKNISKKYEVKRGPLI